MSILLTRHFTKPNHNPLDDVVWTKRVVETCSSPVEAPDFWSDTAVAIAASHYLKRSANEFSIMQLIQRVVGAIGDSGQAQGYFKDGEAAVTFADELRYILVHQLGSFNSPVYFNVGIFASYGIAGRSESFRWDDGVGGAMPLTTAFVHPQASACFIQDVRDDLLSIFELLKNEAKIFKYGSGSGTNFSALRGRGEPLEGGGESSGLISYLEVFDKAAQAIKSGGTTRRAAKMVLLDADHPEIQEFILWKMHEERKARILLANGYSSGMEGEAFRTVSGQNSNNSVRVTDEFMRRAVNGEAWPLRSRRDGHEITSVNARTLLHDMARAAWECADPGIQFSDTIERWHLCPNSGPIRASNPCSEYMFIDNSACNLASINLLAFLKGGQFDWDGFKQSVRLLLLAQDILVDYASYPSAAIAENSHRFRPLGLGYANLGGLLMCLGIPYDSEAAALWTAQITGAMHALALETSQNIARVRGAFSAWPENQESARQVISRHAEIWTATSNGALPWVTDTFTRLLKSLPDCGLRNAQVTLLAPTGTIGLFMDCATLGIEPDFSLVKRKSLAGGREIVMANPCVETALANLQYSPAEIAPILTYMLEHAHLVGAPGLRPEHLPVFDCAMAPKKFRERRVSAAGHLRIMAAAQPFLSGSISKTVNLPTETTVDEINALFLQAWKLGLKSLAIYRDGSKALQPLCVEC